MSVFLVVDTYEGRTEINGVYADAVDALHHYGNSVQWTASADEPVLFTGLSSNAGRAYRIEKWEVR